MNWETNPPPPPSPTRKQPLKIDSNKCRHKCTVIFGEDDRLKLSNEYWSIESFNLKKQFILSNVKIGQVNRVPADPKQRKRERSWSKHYFFTEERLEQRVCKAFFLSTLNISLGPVDNAFSKKNENGISTGEDG